MDEQTEKELGEWFLNILDRVISQNDSENPPQQEPKDDIIDTNMQRQLSKLPESEIEPYDLIDVAVPLKQASIDRTFAVKGRFKIDADGAPNAYGPKDSGLDNIKYAGKPGKWHAIATDKQRKHIEVGTPYIQGPNDPAPGMYVSKTALFDRSKSKRDQTRYVNSNEVHYIVSNPEIKKRGGQIGDYVTVVRKIHLDQIGKDIEIIEHGIIADSGPKNGKGEGSMSLAKSLGINPNPRKGGSDKMEFDYIIYPGSGKGAGSWPISNTTIRQTGMKYFKKYLENKGISYEIKNDE